MRRLSKKKIFYRVFILAVFIIGFQASCSDDNNDNGGGGNFSATLSTTNPNSEGEILKLTIDSEGSDRWNVNIEAADQSWIIPDGISGVGDTILGIKIEKNSTNAPRFSKIVVNRGTTNIPFYITQNNYSAPIEVPTNLKWFEIPEKSNLPNTVLVSHMMPENSQIRNYSLLYDTKNRVSYWVAYPLHSYYLGKTERTDDWNYDPNVSTNSQAIVFRGYGISGIDRGHQLPSADRTRNSNTNATTFYFTNQTPQNSDLNRGIWERLESKVRKWVANCDTLYVVTGAMITTSTDKTIQYVSDNYGNKVAKPKYYYKALAQKKGNTYYTLAYRFDNKAYGSADIDGYRKTVADLEKETGFTFFPALTNEVKSEIVTAQWK